MNICGVLNTYGLLSMGSVDLLSQSNSKYFYSQKIRDLAQDYLPVHNLVLNILGYIPGVSAVSGSVRMVTGLTMLVTALTFNEKHTNLFNTGISQIGRGALEAFIPFGGIVNGSLDVLATCIESLAIRNLGRTDRKPSPISASKTFLDNFDKLASFD